MYFLYRHFDANGALLYVGLSANYERRKPTHRYSAWYEQISRVSVQACDIDKHAALQLEREVITAEQPRHNLLKKGQVVSRGTQQKQREAKIALKEKMLALLGEGMSCADIARRVGISRQRAHQILYFELAKLKEDKRGARMTLSEFVDKLGDEEAGKLFGISQYTARAYRHGTRSPKPRDVPRIIEATGGLLTWADVYAAELAKEAKP